MRIGIDARTLTLPELRGIASYLLELLKIWPEHQDTFILFTENFPRPNVLKSPSQIEWFRVESPKGSRLHIWEWWALPKAVRKKKVDIFWSPANCAIPFIGVPQIVTVHDTLLQERIQFDDRLEQFYFCKLVPFFLRWFADRVITVSYFASDRIQEIFRYPDRDIRIIYNGASLPVQRFDTRQAAMCYLEKKGIVKKRFIYVLGAESPWKNTTGILKAFKIVKSRFPDSYLVLSGIQNRASFFYENLIRDLGIGDSVKLLGFIPANIRDALYQGADVFVYPSLFEGFGLPPLEAMAMKTPVVASDAASIPEVVSNAAFLVDARFPENLADGIIQLLSDEKIRNTCIRRGLQNIRRFDWGASAIMHRKLMKEIRKR